MGLTSSGEIFCQKTDEALASIPEPQKLVDDIMITGRTKKELLERIETLFKRCHDKQITLSKSTLTYLIAGDAPLFISKDFSPLDSLIRASPFIRS